MKQIGLKRLLALFMVLALCFSLLPVSALAEGEDGDVGFAEEFEEPVSETPEEGEDLLSDEIPCEHEPAEAVSENEIAPGCTEPGSHDAVVYCALCGAELSR